MPLRGLISNGGQHTRASREDLSRVALKFLAVTARFYQNQNPMSLETKRSKSPKSESYLRRRRTIFDALLKFTIAELKEMYSSGIYLDEIRSISLDVLLCKMAPVEFQKYVNGQE